MTPLLSLGMKSLNYKNKNTKLKLSLWHYPLIFLKLNKKIEKVYKNMYYFNIQDI